MTWRAGANLIAIEDYYQMMADLADKHRIKMIWASVLAGERLSQGSESRLGDVPRCGRPSTSAR